MSARDWLIFGLCALGYLAPLILVGVRRKRGWWP